ncbi:MAG: trypsin-like peptidase domain-containing protein [Actinophytocola sp.]|uniref:S1C family serine protease n=1 Tax=Actinophytocola sp. TaxID=1872138 RepID=UPI003C77DE0B
MNNQWNSEPDPPSNGSAVPGSDDRPRLGPRPSVHPPVDPGSAAVFGRPSGVGGAFSPRSPQQQSALGDLKTAPPPPEALTSAFGRPDGNQELLQRPPSDENGVNGVDPWDPDAAHDPWRDPAAGAVIGPPAVGPEKTDDDKTSAPKPAAQLLSLPEVLFGRRVKVSALVILAVFALVIGVGGGIAAYFVADRGDQLTSDATLAEVVPGKERPPGSVADISKRVRPAVVTIEVRSEQGAGVGSGAVIDSGGYILTNEHVVTLGGAVSDGQQITVVFNDGQRAEADLVGSDPKMDLAVVKVDADVSTVIQLGKSADLAVGDTVLAIGSPLGETDTVTLGIVSALNRPVVVGEEDGVPAVYDAIQTDAAINHGNSGGPLVDSTGALVGINTSIISTSEEGGSIGLGYAIPIDDARPVAESLIKTGKVNHADLGVNAASVSAETAEGARVQNVREGGAAAKAGIKQNDVIRKVGDRPIANAAELIVAVRHYKIGDTVPVVLARDGRELTVQVTLQSD